MTAHSHILIVITREFQVINLIEAGLWIALGLGAMVAGVRRGRHVRRDLLILSVALMVFGLSDIVETQTGAWWKPWWLLAWKAACLLIMLLLLMNHLRRRTT